MYVDGFVRLHLQYWVGVATGERAWRSTGPSMFVAKNIPTDHKDLIHDVAYDFYGKRMATCSSDQSVKVIAWWALFRYHQCTRVVLSRATVCKSML